MDEKTHGQPDDDDEAVEDLEAPAESQEQVAGGRLPLTCGGCLVGCDSGTWVTD